MVTLHKDSAEGSGLFTHTTVWIDHKPQERVVAKCTGADCHQIIDKTSKRNMPAGQMLRYISDHGWGTNPILCPACRRKHRENKMPETFNPVLPVQPAPVVTPDPPAAAPKLNGSAAPFQPMTTEMRVHISGKVNAKQLHYGMRIPKDVTSKLAPNHRKAKAYVCDGRFVLIFSDYGSRVSDSDGNFSSVTPNVGQGMVAPNVRTSSFSLPAVFDGKIMVTANFPPNLTPVKAQTLNAAILEHLGDLLPPKVAYAAPPPPVVAPVAPAVAKAPPIAVPDPAAPRERDNFSDSDVAALMDLLKQCAVQRPDIVFETRDGRVVAKKTTYVEIG